MTHRQQPNRWLLSIDMESIRQAIGRMETQMLGYHFTDQCADDVSSLARRLENLTLPNKGHMKDGATTQPLKDAA